MKKNTFTKFIVFSILLCSCNHREIMPWEKTEVDGLYIELVDDKTIANYSFAKNGYVAATIGKIDGFVAGPVLSWEITSDGNLLILDEISSFKIILEKIYKTDKAIRVLENGKEREYRIISK